MQNNATKRTINLLADSLKNLLNVKEINKITINEITKDSGVNRQTFYYHFHDIYELCSYMIERDLQELMPSRGNDVTDWKNAMITLLEYLEENPKEIDSTTRDAYVYYKDLHDRKMQDAANRQED